MKRLRRLRANEKIRTLVRETFIKPSDFIYIAPSQFESMFVSDMHSEQDIEKTVHIIEKYFHSL